MLEICMPICCLCKMMSREIDFENFNTSLQERNEKWEMFPVGQNSQLR